MTTRRLVRACIPTLAAAASALVAVAMLPAAPAAAAAVPSVGGLSPTLGTTSGGTRVTVTGSGFSGVTSVKFGTRAGRSIKVLSRSKLRVTTPAHAAGLVNVRVTTKTGTSAIRTADRFRFVGKPTISKISPTSGPSIGGTWLTITGTGFYSVTGVTIGGKAGTARTVVSPTSLKVTTPAGTSGAARVVVRTAFGNSAGKTFTYVPSWHDAQLIDSPMGGFQFVSCAGRICMAVDRHDNVLIYSGSGWSDPKKLVMNGHITALSCGSPTRCVVGDDTGYVVVWNGFGWSAPRKVTADSSAYISALSCSSATSCVAIDGNGNYTVFNGTTWTAPQWVLADTFLSFSSLSCTSATFCMGFVTTWSEVDGTAGTDAYEFHGVNTGWSGPVPLTSGWALSDLSCSTLATGKPYCVAVDAENDYMTWDADADWSAPAEITLTQPEAWVIGVACTPLEDCWAVDSSGVAYAWNGVVWSGGTPVVAAFPFDIACATTTRQCALVDGDNQATRYVPGTGWTTPTRLMITHGGIQSISCPTRDFCVAVDVGGYAFRWNGVRWSDPINLVAPDGMLSSVSCISPTHCAASSWNGQAVVFDGTSWVTTQLWEGMGKVSCATSDACVAVGWHNAFVWNGLTWSDAVPLITDDLAPGLRDISWLRTGADATWIAVDAAGHTYTATDPDGTWSAGYTVPVVGDEVSGLSCSPDGLCIAISAQSSAWESTGGDWVSAGSLGEYDGDPVVVSCAPGNYCAAASWSGTVYTRTVSGGWSHKHVSQGYSALLSVSCESAAFCMAGDNEGRVYGFA